MTRAARQRERGYALLAVLFVGAVMAIMLYMVLPREAFEAQRAKEDDLMYRGGQYARAVRLYFRKNHKYPARLEDLEKTNNIRFLRKRYEDPIAKKDEWRFIHIGPMGVFTDSLVYDKPKQKKEGEAAASNWPDTSGAAAGAAGQITGMADRLRSGAAGTMPPSDGSGAPGQPAYFNLGQPGAAQPGPGQPGYGQPQPGVYPAGGVPGNVAAYPYQDTSGQQFNYPQQVTAPPGAQPAFPPGVTGQMGTAPMQPGAYPPGAFPGAQPQRPGASGIGSPAAGSEAARIIQQLLMTPRPGGLAGLPPGAPGSTFGPGPGAGPGQPGGSFSLMGPGGAAGAGPTFGAGIAGVASKSEARGIKVYNDRETYNEWEFVYDYRRDPLLMGAAAGAGVPGLPGAVPAGAQAGQPGAFGQQPGAFGQPNAFGQPATFGQPSAFGQPSGFGQPSTFGQPGFGQPGQQPVTPINPSQPGLPSSPFGPPRRR